MEAGSHTISVEIHLSKRVKYSNLLNYLLIIRLSGFEPGSSMVIKYANAIN